MDPECGLFDDRFRPGPGNELLFRDRLAGTLDERDQNIERAAAEAQRFSVLEEDALSGDQTERSEGEGFFIHREAPSEASRLISRVEKFHKRISPQPAPLSGREWRATAAKTVCTISQPLTRPAYSAATNCGP